MQSKDFISPEPIPHIQVKSQIRQLFLPLFSYYAALTITTAFFCEILVPILTDANKQNVYVPIFYGAFLFCWPMLVAYFGIKKFNVIITTEGISGNTFWGRRTHAIWSEIILVKTYWLLGARFIYLKKLQGKAIHLSPFSYDAQQIIESVKYYAGAEHPLVRALEKETTPARQRPFKLWWRIIAVIALIISIWLIGGNLWAAEVEKPLNAAITDYKQRHPQTPPNKSAIELQVLMTKLGMSLEIFDDGSKAQTKPRVAAVAELKGITTQPVLAEFLETQLDKTEDTVFLASSKPSEALPPKLASYLKNHEADLLAIEDYVINHPLPQWGIDAAFIEKNIDNTVTIAPIEKTQIFNVANLQNLIIANILDKQQSPNANLNKDLAALQKVHQSLQAEKQFLGQSIVNGGENRINKLIQKVDQIPLTWGEELFSQKRHQQSAVAINDEAIFASSLIRSTKAFGTLATNMSSPWLLVTRYHHLIQPYLRIAAADFYQKVQQSADYWGKQNICRTDGRVTTVVGKSMLGFDDLDTMSPIANSTWLAQASVKNLRWEFTKSIREVKTKLKFGQPFDQVAKEFNWQSKVCPGDKWTAQAQDNGVNISFSYLPNWNMLGVKSKSVIPTTYKIKVKA
jgi:hypothetical protein